MNPRRGLQASFWAMIALQTIAGVDLPRGKTSSSSPLGGKGTRKLPTPRLYVAATVLWAILGLVAETGEAQARLAARLSYLVLLTGAVFGPFGQRAVSFLNAVSGRFAIAPPTPGAGPAGGHGGLRDVLNAAEVVV